MTHSRTLYNCSQRPYRCDIYRKHD